MRPELNWFGWSTETISAVYETDMACREWEQGLVNKAYFQTACDAELYELELDLEIKNAA